MGAGLSDYFWRFLIGLHRNVHALIGILAGKSKTPAFALRSCDPGQLNGGNIATRNLINQLFHSFVGSLIYSLVHSFIHSLVLSRILALLWLFNWFQLDPMGSIQKCPNLVSFLKEIKKKQKTKKNRQTNKKKLMET